MGKENSKRGIHPSDLSVLAVAVGIKKKGSFFVIPFEIERNIEDVK
jgi:hypothetical protein